MIFNLENAPEHELTRSKSALRVAELSYRSGLFLSHFEYRKQGVLPEHWQPFNRPDLGTSPTWKAGILPESKYQGFRTDLRIGSFHPGHQAKWTTHELCHGLVGFAWNKDASPFFHATAARLAELLPVALFYFFDEAFLQKCNRHENISLFGTYCEECDLMATKAFKQHDDTANDHFKQGMEFIKRELYAVHKSIKSGVPIESPFGNLNLASDGIAYASMQERRLSSKEFEFFTSHFFPDNSGLHLTLESIENRILELADDFTLQSETTPLNGSKAQWISQDLAWRLLEIKSETDGECSMELEKMILALRSFTENAIESTISAYELLAEDYYIPSPEEVFAVGYHLPKDYGYSIKQIRNGLHTVCPNALSEITDKELYTWVQNDKPSRRPIGKRFFHWLNTNDSSQSSMAELECTLTHLKTSNGFAESFGTHLTEPLFTNPNAELLYVTENELYRAGLAENTSTDSHVYIVLLKEFSGETLCLELDKITYEYLQSSKQNNMPVSLSSLDEDTLYQLVEHTLLINKQWTLSLSESI